MSRVRGLTRAGFVGGILATGLALAPLRPWRVLVAVEPRAPAARLARLLHDRAGAGAIGLEYLRSRPGEATPAALVEEIARSVPDARAALVTASPHELRALLAARSSADFAEGRTVILRGWILSETEARLCALLSLGARGGAC